MDSGRKEDDVHMKDENELDQEARENNKKTNDSLVRSPMAPKTEEVFLSPNF